MVKSSTNVHCHTNLRLAGQQWMISQTLSMLHRLIATLFNIRRRREGGERRENHVEAYHQH